MKKKLMALATCVMVTMGLVACGGEDKKEVTKAKITLGKYKGMEVEESIATITDKELEDYVQYILESHKTTEKVDKGTTKKEDKIVATYTAKKDGEKISALSATNTTITLDEDAFAIKGFIDQLIGKEVGTTVEFDIKIQDDFSKKEYQGMDVHYEVKIEALVVTSVPELTDEWAKKNYEYLGITTAQEFKDYYKNNLYLNTIYNEVIDDVLKNQKVESYDSAELEELTKMYADQFKNEIGYYGVEFNAYLQAMEKTEEEFNKEMEDKAKEYLKQKMFVMEVVKEENLSISDELYKAKMLEMAKSMNLNSQEELESYYDGYMDEEDYRYTIYGEMVQQILCDNIVKVPDKEKPTTEKETKEEATTVAK